jgi:hypothetical protein
MKIDLLALVFLLLMATGGYVIGWVWWSGVFAGTAATLTLFTFAYCLPPRPGL